MVGIVAERFRGPAWADETIAPEVLVAEANHRIANNLTLIAGVVRLQAAGVAKRGAPLSAEDARLMLEEVSTRIETVGRLHRLLAGAGRDGVFDLSGYLADIAEAAVASMAVGDAALVDTSTADCAIEHHHALPVGFIIGELVTNAVKYAHPSGVAGRIALGCHKTADGRTWIEVADDGVGLPEGFDPLQEGGLGMRMVRSLAGQLDAELTFHSSDVGLTVRLEMPRAGGFSAAAS